MDSDNQPSTSKKYISKLRTNPPDANAMYPVTFDQFKKYTKVEEYVLKEMKNAGPDKYKINYKIRDKYYPIVYKKFYSNKATRKQMFRNGFELKPMPKFLKDKLMMMPTGDVESTADLSNNNNDASSLSHRIELLNSRKRSPQSEKENCRTKTVNSSKKETPKPGRPKNKPLNNEMRKITTFFTALKSPAGQITELDVRKRKACLSSPSAEPGVKRLKNARPKSENIPKRVQKISEGKGKPQQKETETPKLDKFPSDLISDDAASNVQIMVEVPVPVNIELSSEMKTRPKLPDVNEPNRKIEPSNNNKITRTTCRNKRKSCERRPRNCSIPTVYTSDDSNIESNEVDDPGSIDSDVVRVAEEICLIIESSPLPRRNRMENFKNHSLSPEEKNLHKDADPVMSVFNLSERSSPIFNLSSTVAGTHGVEEGVTEFEGNVTAKNIEFPREDFISVDRLEAIRTHSAKVQKYIKHLLNLEIQKTRGRAAQVSSRSKVVSAFLQMSFDEYKYLVKANSLSFDGILPADVIISLEKQYEAIVEKKKPWPKGVHIKLATLRKFLQSKGILPPIQLQHIPPRILNFMDILANTNLKEYISFSRQKPPGSYKSLLHLCKKEYRKCCEDGIWSDGVQFKDTTHEEVNKTESVPLLKGESSGGEVTEAQSAQKSLQVEQVANSSTADPEQMVEDKYEQADKSNPNSQLKKKKKRAINSFQSDQRIEDYLDAMFKDSDSELETTQCTAITDHDYLAINPKTLADEDKHRDPSIDQITVAAVETVPTDALLASPKKSLGLSKPKQITEDANIPAASENPLAFKESDPITENGSAPAEMAAPEPLPPSSEESVGIITDNTPDSAGELLSGIIRPKQTENNSEFLIPPSPNLFQSSGESRINCTQSQDFNAQPPETVYVPCKHGMSMTCNTEQNNLTVCTDPTSDSEDPFVETCNNQEGNTETQLPLLDPGLVVKRELLSQRDVPTEAIDALDDSLYIIEVPSPEPIVITDSEEMAQRLLDILMSQPTKSVETEFSRTVNQSNRNNKHSESLMTQAIPVEKDEEIERVPEVSDSQLPETKVFIPLTRNLEVSSQPIVPEEGVSDLVNSLEIVDVPSPEPIVIDDEETAPELLDILLSRPTKTTHPEREHAHLNPCHQSFSCLDNFQQAQRFPSRLSFTQGQSIIHQCHDVPCNPEREEAQNGNENEESPRVDLDVGVQSSAPSNEVDEQSQMKETDTSRNATEDIFPSGSSESVSYVSITPQNIPADIDFIQSEVNHEASQIADQLLSEDFDDDESMVCVYVTLGSDDTEEHQPIVSAMKIVYSEAEKPVTTGLRIDIPEDRTTHVDSLNNVEEAAGSSIQDQHLNTFTPSNCDIFHALELPVYGEVEISSVEGTGLQETKVDASLEIGSKSAEDDDASKTSKGHLVEGGEKHNDSKEVSTINQLFKKLQQSCVSADQSKVGNEASDRHESQHYPDQLKIVDSSEAIQQCHISVDAAPTNASTVSLTPADESKANDKAPPKHQLNQGQEVELQQDAEDGGNPALSPTKDAGAPSNYPPQATRYLAQQAEVKTKTVELPKAVTNAFVEDLPEAVSSRQTQQNHVPDTVPVVYCATLQGIADFEKQLQNVRISRGTHRRHVSKNDAQNDGMASASGGNNQETRSSEHIQETGESEQTHLFAEKSTISTGESQDRSGCQKMKPESWRDEAPFSDESTNVMLSSAIEGSLPAEVFIYGSQQIEQMDINDEDGVPGDTFSNICPYADYFEVTVETSENRHISEATGSHESSNMPQSIGAPNTTEVIDLPAKSTTQRTYTFPALLPIGAISNDRPDEIIEGETIVEADEEAVVVPFLIKGRFLKSLPFKILSQNQLQLHWKSSQFLGIEAKFETNLTENTNLFLEPIKVAVEKEATQHSEVTFIPVAKKTQNKKKTEIKVPAPAPKNPKVCKITASEPIHLKSRQSLQKSDISSTFTVSESTVSRTRAQSKLPKMVRVDRESQISVQPKSTQPPPKQKPIPKTSKMKATPKKSAKKPDPELVPQKVHAFRSLPMGAVNKPLSSETPTTHAPLTTVEEIDFFIEDASQVIPTSTTASQMLAIDCTYFESSKLLNNIDEYCAQKPTPSKQSVQHQCHSRTNPKVNTLNHPKILSDGITARKVWKVHLQWTTQRKMIVETRFITGGHWLSSYDESAKLMFHFSPTTWSDIFRVLKEIDHYEYRRMAVKERKHCPVVTPLHRVLRYLFDTAPQIVNVRLINDIHSPFTMCEKSTALYRKPFQCLTKGIPASVLNRMKALKRDLRTANSDADISSGPCSLQQTEYT